LRRGSVAVQPGERVRAGQLVGRMGNSGDSIFPHLHYELGPSPQPFQADGLPARFRHFRRLHGTTAIDVELGTPETGDFVTSAVPTAGFTLDGSRQRAGS
jgi:murein DD-endopeptidase MepM/ murein hydrolase activator NlpD